MINLIRFTLRCVAYVFFFFILVIPAVILLPAAAVVLLFDWAFDNWYWNDGWKPLIKDDDINEG